jgi:hypothetical protein
MTEQWVRNWFARHFEAGDVFHDGAEALTIAAAVQLCRDAQAAEREHCIAIVRNAASHGCACSDRDALADVLVQLGASRDAAAALDAEARAVLKGLELMP